MADQIEVKFINLRETRKILNQLAPDIKKQLDKANRQLVRPLIDASRQNFPDKPMSNWGAWTSNGRNLSYDIGTVRKGIKVKQRGRSKRSEYSSVMTLLNESAAGAIFESGGRQSDSQFNDNLQRWYQVPKNGLMRGIWKAIFKDVGTKEITRQIEANYQEAVKEAQRRMDALK